MEFQQAAMEHVVASFLYAEGAAEEIRSGMDEA